MYIIDRYLTWQFFKALLIFFITFAGLFVVIDAFGNLDEFIEHGEKAGGLLRVVVGYYGVRMLALLDRTSGVLTLVAAMFTLTALERNNELTALMAAGIPRRRMARPIIGAVLAVSLIAVMNREVILPKYRDQLSRNAQDLGGERGHRVQLQWDHQTDVLINGTWAYKSENRIEKPSIGLPDAVAQFGTQVLAANAIAQDAADGRPTGYLLQDVRKPVELLECKSIALNGKPLLLCPSDTPWLNDKDCFLVTNVQFEQLAGGDGWKKFASTAELMTGLRNPSTDFGPDVRVAVHSRFVQPLLDLTLLFLGLPLVLSRQSRNIFVAIGMCLVLVLGFYVVVIACHSLGNNCLIRPALAAWCPLLICVPVAVYMAQPMSE